MAIGLIPGPLGKVLTPTTSPTRTVSTLSTFRQATPITIAKSAMTPMRSISTMTVPTSQPSGGIVAAIKNMTASPVTSGIHSSGISFGGSGGSGPTQSGGAASRFGGSVSQAMPSIVAPPSPSGADNSSQPTVPMAPLQASPTPGQPSFDGGGGGGAPDELAPAQADAGGGLMPSSGMSFSPTMIAVGAALALGVGLLLLRRPSAAPQILKV